MSKRQIFAALLEQTGLGTALGSLQAALTRQVLLLGYHRVLDVPDEARFPFDPELVSASVAQFRRQMQMLSDRYSPITCETLIQYLDGKGSLPKRPVIVTFDDGFADNYEHAFPVLKEIGMPATIFVSTDYIGTDKVFWFDRVVQVLLKCSQSELVFDSLGGMHLYLGQTVESRRSAAERLLIILKAAPDAKRLQAVEELEQRVEPETLTSARELSRILNWEQIIEMSQSGIEFGSHSRSHPVLARLDQAGLKNELRGSREIIEAKIGKPVQVLSYPVGGFNDISEVVTREVRAAGYRLGVSYIPGTNYLRSFDRFRMRRQHIERYLTQSYVKSMLNLPGLF